MLKLSPDQRKLLAESLKDAANVGAGVMLFGQTVGSAPFSLATFATGLLLWFVLTIVALGLAGNPNP